MSDVSPFLDGLKIDSTDDGLHLRGSILWLDAKANGQLSFLSQACEHSKALSPQIVSTEETVKIIEVFKKKPNALVCQYNRPFSIGQLKMEVLPSGHALGGASLFVETPKSSFLYAPQVQISKNRSNRLMQIKPANTLLLNAQSPDPSYQAQKHRARSRDALLAATLELVEQQKWPYVICQGMPIAQELTRLFTDHGIATAVHQQFYKINKVYESYGSDLGTYSLYSPRRSRNKLVIIPTLFARRGRPPQGLERPRLYVNETIDQHALDLNGLPSENHFQIHRSSFGSDFFEIIEKVRPKEVCFFGQYAKSYCEFYEKSLQIPVKPLFSNDQPPLL